MFRVRCSRGEMYTGPGVSDHGHLCVCLSVCLSICLSVCLCVCLSFAACPHYCTDPDVTWGNGRGCPLVVHYWADLQSVHGLRCYDNIAPNVKCQRVLVLALCLVYVVCGSSQSLYAVYMPVSGKNESLEGF